MLLFSVVWRWAIGSRCQMVVRLFVLVTGANSLGTKHLSHWQAHSATSNSLLAIIGKLNIAHHKSYHPYRRDNIERVRKDEEEAREKETRDEGRMMLAVGFPLPFAPSDLRIMSRILKLG